MASYKWFAASCLLTLVGGCATLPQLDVDDVTTAMVVLNIKCEMQRALKVNSAASSWLKEWNSAFVLSLQMTHKGGVSVDASLSHPMTPGAFVLPIGLNAGGEATRTEKITFKERLDSLAGAQLGCPATPVEDRRAMLGGRLGFDELLARAQESIDVARIKPTQLDYSINFRVIRGGNIGPRFNVVGLGRNTLTAGARWEGSSEGSHTLTLALAKNPQPCLFPELETKYGTCPLLTANYPLIESADPRSGPRTFSTPGEPEKSETRDTTRVRKPSARDMSGRADEALDRALTRSILQDTLEELRRGGFSTP